MGKLKTAYKNTCDFCGNEFKTAMPFAKFCCDNHRKYFFNCKKHFELEIRTKAMWEHETLIKLLNGQKNLSITELNRTIEEASKKMDSLKTVHEKIYLMVKQYIEKKRKHKLR